MEVRICAVYLTERVFSCCLRIRELLQTALEPIVEDEERAVCLTGRCMSIGLMQHESRKYLNPL